MRPKTHRFGRFFVNSFQNAHFFPENARTTVQAHQKFSLSPWERARVRAERLWNPRNRVTTLHSLLSSPARGTPISRRLRGAPRRPRACGGAGSREIISGGYSAIGAPVSRAQTEPRARQRT